MGFVRSFWHLVEPGAPFKSSWHLEAMAEFCLAVFRGEIKRGVINVPPGMTKSVLVSLLFPSYVHALEPEHKFLALSYSSRVVLRDAERQIDLMRSELFRDVFPGSVLKSSKPAANKFYTTRGGLRLSSTVRGDVTGFHGHTVIFDDPIKPLDAGRGPDGAAMQEVLNFYDGTLQTRQADASRFAILLIMQRLAEGDLAERMLEEGADHLMLPMRYEPSAKWDRGNRAGIEDRRTEPGELLCPERFDDEAVGRLEKALKGAASAQLQQNPMPDKGGIFERGWFRYGWAELPKTIQLVQSWDFSAKSTKKSHSRVSGQLWGAAKVSEVIDRTTGARIKLPAPELKFLLLDERSGWWGYSASKEQFGLCQLDPLWKRAHVKLVEDKANGTGIIDDFKKGCRLEDGRMVKVNGIDPTSPKDDKETRAVIASDKPESGMVLLPPPGPNYPWVDKWLDEIVGFPNASHDDRVDAAVQAWERLDSKFARVRSALEKLGGMPA